jgi:hypothetical protein
VRSPNLEEESIKSALEIAMERVSRLPELTPEEIAEQKEKELRPIGQAISNKYMQGQIAEAELSEELNNHQGDKGEIVRSALIAGLCQSIQLEDVAQATKALQGLASLKKGELQFLEEIKNSFALIKQDFERERQIIFKEQETVFKNRLEIAGISGSAVKPNLVENEDWLHTLNGLCRAYEPRVKEIRNQLTRRLL